MRKVLADGKAVIGEVGNGEHMLEQLGKAGAKRWRGIRPTVRGMSMNPIDHPHGGGEDATRAFSLLPLGSEVQGLQDPQEQTY